MPQQIERRFTKSRKIVWNRQKKHSPRIISQKIMNFFFSLNAPNGFVSAPGRTKTSDSNYIINNYDL